MDHILEFSALLGVKLTDLRGSLLTQCRHAVDKGIHIGGALSALPPMAALFYGGMRLDVENPTSEDQDVFILSKGHAVAALAAVYADAGYFDPGELLNSRGWGALVKGHPGPAMPGVPVATGPLGQGLSIGCGYALRQRELGPYDTYVLCGDGELQEGSCWEAVQFAGDRGLQNLCLIVDRNRGQSDNTAQLFVSMDALEARLGAFGFDVLRAGADNMPALLRAFEHFRREVRDGRPTAILCDGFKGFGGHMGAMGKHKGSFGDAELDAEARLIEQDRLRLVRSLARFDPEVVRLLAGRLGYTLEGGELRPTPSALKLKRAPKRDKAVPFSPSDLPRIELGQPFAPTDLGIAIARAFAPAPNFYSIDSDLSNVSGLFTGGQMTNRAHALNVGIAECLMMCMAEALAAQGANVWTSTFGPFFDWRALRRIAVSYEEREDAIESPSGWLAEGHNLDITFLSTASNLDTAVNGATHMSNDDITTFAQLAHVKIIDTSCPQQFLAVARWSARGNRGLVYLRVMRNASPALYAPGFEFEYGKGYLLKRPEGARAAVVSSGHGVTEALKAASLLEAEGVPVAVVDMPSYDGALLHQLLGRMPVLIAEQNNGWLYDQLCRERPQGALLRLNVRDARDRLRFVQSGSYEQLIEHLGLGPKSIAQAVRRALS